MVSSRTTGCLSHPQANAPSRLPLVAEQVHPFWAGAEHHDFHHMAFSNNFATSFRWWDWALGTDKKYREHVARVKAAKAALKGKGASREELVRAQYQLMKQAEEEGAVEEAEVCRTASFKFFKTD